MKAFRVQSLVVLPLCSVVLAACTSSSGGSKAPAAAAPAPASQASNPTQLAAPTSVPDSLNLAPKTSAVTLTREQKEKVFALFNDKIPGLASKILPDQGEDEPARHKREEKIRALPNDVQEVVRDLMQNCQIHPVTQTGGQWDGTAGSVIHSSSSGGLDGTSCKMPYSINSTTDQSILSFDRATGFGVMTVHGFIDSTMSDVDPDLQHRSLIIKEKMHSETAGRVETTASGSKSLSIWTMAVDLTLADKFAVTVAGNGSWLSGDNGKLQQQQDFQVSFADFTVPLSIISEKKDKDARTISRVFLNGEDITDRVPDLKQDLQ